MDMQELFNTRRQALKRLIKQRADGNVASFARQNQLDATYLRQLLNRDLTFGEKSARKLEEQCGLNEFYFDIPNHDKISSICAMLRRLSDDDLWEIEKAVEVNMAKRRVLTQQENAWAQNLKHLYLLKKSELGIQNQTELGQLAGITQSAVTQYMNGKIPLNISAKLAFSNALKADIREIDPNFKLEPALSEDEQTLLSNYRMSSESGREALLRVSRLALESTVDNTSK